MYLYMRLSRKSYVKLWHKCSYGHAKKTEKGCNVIRYSGRGMAIQFLRTFFNMETNHCVPLHASLP